MAKSKSGFTIVELLIVIVVIGILAAITVVAFNGIQTRAYNSQRKSDLAALVKGLEMYRVENNRYPTPTWNRICLSAGGWDCWDDSVFGGTPGNRLLSAEQMPKMPQDPQYSDAQQSNYPNPHLARLYGYQSDTNGTGYILATYMPGLSPSDPNYWDGSTTLGGGGYLNWANYLIRKNL